MPVSELAGTYSAKQRENRRKAREARGGCDYAQKGVERQPHVSRRVVVHVETSVH